MSKSVSAHIKKSAQLSYRNRKNTSSLLARVKNDLTHIHWKRGEKGVLSIPVSPWNIWSGLYGQWHLKLRLG